MNFTDKVASCCTRVDAAMERYLLPGTVEPATFHEAMRYAVLGSGKRIRPLLAYASGEALGVDADLVDPIAIAVEFFHAYSLAHDDLPAMDDDDLRRGRPTTHVAYDEATAILVGDALQALAFEVLTAAPVYRDLPEARIRMVVTLADATGSTGMAGGQIMDLEAENNWVDARHLEEMYTLKTGRLIQAAITMPAYCRPEISSDKIDALDRYAQTIGLAFQIKDDLLEFEESTDTIGKSRGSDEKNAKATYPSLFGYEKARDRAEQLYRDAMAELEFLGPSAEFLNGLCEFIVRRKY